MLLRTERTYILILIGTSVVHLTGPLVRREEEGRQVEGNSYTGGVIVVFHPFQHDV